MRAREKYANIYIELMSFPQYPQSILLLKRRYK